MYVLGDPTLISTKIGSVVERIEFKFEKFEKLETCCKRPATRTVRGEENLRYGWWEKIMKNKAKKK